MNLLMNLDTHELDCWGTLSKTHPFIFTLKIKGLDLPNKKDSICIVSQLWTPKEAKRLQRQIPLLSEMNVDVCISESASAHLQHLTLLATSQEKPTKPIKPIN